MEKKLRTRERTDSLVSRVYEQMRTENLALEQRLPYVGAASSHGQEQAESIHHQLMMTDTS